MYRKTTYTLMVTASCVVFSALAPAPANAVEIFGICLSGDCKEVDDSKDFIDPKTYDISFEVSDIDEDLQNAVKSSSELWRGREDPVAGGAGLIARAKGDYRRILAGLYNKGHYAGSISILVNGAQASSIPAGQELPDNSSVKVIVDPGAEYLFGQTKIENEAPLTDDPKDQVKSPSEVGFQTGEVAEAGAVRRAEIAARRAWRQQGHPLAEVADKTAKAYHPDQKLNVVMRMAPGPRADFGDLTVEGTQRMDPEFVRYMTGLVPGTEYDPDDLEKARKRLDRLGVFSSRKLEEGESVTNGLLPVNLAVNERKLRRIGAGATVSSVDGTGLEAFWLHRNLWGKAERLRLEGSIGGFGSTSDPERFDYLLSATLTQPGTFSPDTDLVWNAFLKREINENFEEESGGASANLTNFYSDEITYTIGAFGKYGNYVDAFGERTFATAGFNGEITYDKRDSKTDPTKGFFLLAKANPFYEFEFGNAAVRLEAEGRAYKALDDEGTSVIAGRLKLGSIIGPSIAETPPDLLFNAGGGNSIRGFEFKSIGVPGPGGDEVGGLSLLEASLEYRHRINESFGAVAFVDAGTVNSSSFVDFDDDPKVGVGAGIRYFTGLGPIRLDVAVPLNPDEDDPSFAIYAGIGQAF